jgi:hypothetical protein
MRGVGGKGPSVIYDALIMARSLTTTGFSNSFELATGVVPDGTFSGDLTIGKRICHKWEYSLSDNITKFEKETVRLYNFSGKPIL